MLLNKLPVAKISNFGVENHLENCKLVNGCISELKKKHELSDYIDYKKQISRAPQNQPTIEITIRKY